MLGALSGRTRVLECLVCVCTGMCLTVCVCVQESRGQGTREVLHVDLFSVLLCPRLLALDTVS